MSSAFSTTSRSAPADACGSCCRPEIPAWLEAARLHVPNDEAHARIWAITRGDWRLLTAFATWLRQQLPHGEIVANREQIDKFRVLLADADRRAAELPETAALLAAPELAGLRTLVRAARAYDTMRETLEFWQEVCRDTVGPDDAAPGDAAIQSWTPMRWETEIRALAFLGEIGEEIQIAATGRVTTFIVDISDPWLALLAT
jgi:hypothetical protein